MVNLGLVIYLSQLGVFVTSAWEFDVVKQGGIDRLTSPLAGNVGD